MTALLLTHPERNIPGLWSWAEKLWSRLAIMAPSARRLAGYARLPRETRNEILTWLEPVEKLVRSLLVSGALIHLLMTPEGRKLRDLAKLPMPTRPMPTQSERQPPKPIIRIPLPGWNTIAQNYRADRLPAPEPKPEPQPVTDPRDPDNWACTFRVLGWNFGDPCVEHDPGKKPLPTPLRQMLAFATDPLLPRPANEIERGQPETSNPSEPEDKTDPRARKLAIRIEALSRVMKDPQTATLRLARYIARLPRDTLGFAPVPYSRTRHWAQGDACVLDALKHERRLINHFREAEEERLREDFG